MTEPRGRKQNTQRNKACKPENHSDRFYGWYNEAMCDLGKVHRRKGEVRSGEESRPDAIEKHEVDGVIIVHADNFAWESVSFQLAMFAIRR